MILAPLDNMVKIVDTILRTSDRNTWKKLYVLEDVICARGYEYKDGKKMIKLTKAEYDYLKSKYEVII